jgi:hypothetical protein
MLAVFYYIKYTPMMAGEAAGLKIGLLETMNLSLCHLVIHSITYSTKFLPKEIESVVSIEIS